MGMAEDYGRDMRNMINDAPKTFTFGGADYTGTISDLQDRVSLEIGGFEDEPIMTLVVALKTDSQQAVFTTQPAVNDKVTVDSVIYRVKRTEADQFGQTLEMALETPHK